MKFNKTTIFLLAAGLLTTAVQADEKERGPGKGRPEFRGKSGERPDRGAALAKTLGLNEKQAEKMKQLQAEQRAAFGKLMAEARESKNREGVRERFGALREEYQKKIRAILTEEQANKLEEMRRSPQGRPGQRPGGEGKGRPSQRPGGEGKGKGRPSKKGSEASFPSQQYVLNDDRDEHRGRDHDRDGERHHRSRDHDRDERGHHGDRNHDDNRRAEAAERYQKYQQGPQTRGPQRGGPRPPQGPRPSFNHGHGPKVSQARGPQWGGPRAPQGRMQGQGPRPGFGQGHSPKGPQARGPQRGGPRPGFGKTGPGPKGPQIRGKKSHGKPNGCSSCKGSKPGHGPKGPQARGPRPPHGGPKGRPEPHRGHRGPRR